MGGSGGTGAGAAPIMVGRTGVDEPNRIGRDQAIDRLRGLCLVSMAVGHLARAGGTRSPVDELVHAPTWVSGAAGFVFLSGVSVGLVWRSRGGCTPAVRWWTVGRGFFLGLVGLALNLAAIAWFGLVGKPGWYPPAPPTLATVLTGRWCLPASDILALYAALLVAAAVFGPWLVRAPRLVLAGSGLLYVASLRLPSIGPAEVPGAAPTWNLLAWQILFVAGLAAGTRWPEVHDAVTGRRRLVWALGLTGAGFVLVLRLGLNLSERGLDPVGLAAARATLESWWLAKNALGPLRLTLIALIGPWAYALCRRPLPLDRLVVAAGARSLRVYVVSTMAVDLWPALGIGRAPGPAVDLAIVTATVGVLASGLLPPLWRGRPWSF